MVLEQSKNSIAGKPIGDKSADLWKTFANWGDICETRGLDADHTTFVLYAAAPGQLGNLLLQMHAAIDDGAAEAALLKVKAIFNSKKVTTGFGLHLGRFLARGDKFCVSAIRNFHFQSDIDPIEPLRQQLRATLSETTVQDFAASAVGIAKDLVENKLRKHEDPLVAAEEFRRRFQPFVRRHNLAGLLASTTGEPTAADIEKTIASTPMYVRQLNAVNMKADIVVGAVGACLRTTADKIKWADEGTIVEDSLKEFDASLVHRFGLVRDEVEDTHAETESVKRGRLVYRRCAEVQLPLEGQTLPSHFVEGAYNILADRLTIGWHPDYLDLLGKE